MIALGDAERGAEALGERGLARAEVAGEQHDVAGPGELGERRGEQLGLGAASVKAMITGHRLRPGARRSTGRGGGGQVTRGRHRPRDVTQLDATDVVRPEIRLTWHTSLAVPGLTRPGTARSRDPTASVLTSTASASRSGSGDRTDGLLHGRDGEEANEVDGGVGGERAGRGDDDGVAVDPGVRGHEGAGEGVVAALGHEVAVELGRAARW